MSILKCFDCDQNFPTPESLTQHLWTSHLVSEVTADGGCPKCGGSLSSTNATYHYSCFFDVEDRELELFHDTSKRQCPLCDQAIPHEELESHVLNHSLIDWAGHLGADRSCTVCDDSVDDLTAHLACIHTIDREDPNPTDGSRPCPMGGCDSRFTSKGKLLWHIWESHLDNTGTQTTCPGCESPLEIGELTSHLPCIDAPGKSVSKLLPTSDRTCFICDLTVYDSSVLHRHFYQKHLTQRERCPGCKEQLTNAEGADIADHVACIARVTGETPIQSLEPEWPCPACGEIYDSKSLLGSHLERQHLELLLADSRCTDCGEPMSDLSSHLGCILGDTGSDHAVDTLELEPQQMVDEETYFSKLYEFNDREREAERSQNRNAYQNTQTKRLAKQQKAIPELVYVGETYHPNFDTQLIYEYPVEEGESVTDDYLIEQFGFYPPEIVLVGTDQRDSNLPQPGTITFVDETTIGIAYPELDGGLNVSPLRNLSKDDRTYHIAKLLNPAPYDAERNAIEKVQSGGLLRDVVLGRRQLSGTPLRLPAEATGQLNEYQVRAVERVLGTEEVVCIHGPPGTGKTRTLTHLIRLAVSMDMRVLATSHSNQAIDNLLVGTSTHTEPDPSSLHYVGKPAGRDRFLPSQLRDLDEDNEERKQRATAYLNRPTELSIARIGYNTASSVVSEQYQNRSPGDADVVAGTMGSIGGTDSDLGSFDIVIVDEAGQAAQPPTFIPASNAGTLVLAGDHLQLPPYAADEEAKDEHLHISLFEHLLNVYGRDISEFLGLQYRMNEQIVSFPNEHVYDGQIKTASPNRDWQVGGLSPIMAVDISGTEETPPGSNSKRNPEEAKVVANHVKLLRITGLEASDIGVITPYKAQIDAINAAINEKLGRLPNLKVDTVDSFQGSEREAIIVSWVRSNEQNNTGFLSFPEEGKRRLNVAMTRPRKRLVLIGDWNTLGTVGTHEDREDSCSHLFAKLYKFLNDRNLIKYIDH